MVVKRKGYAVITLGASVGLFLVMTSGTERVFAHKAKHTQKQLKSFGESFMEQVCLGALPCRP